MARMQPDQPGATPASPAPSSTHPYQSLTPDVVLDALAALDLHGDGRLQALSSYAVSYTHLTLPTNREV